MFRVLVQVTAILFGSNKNEGNNFVKIKSASFNWYDPNVYFGAFALAFPYSSWVNKSVTLAPLLAEYPFDPNCPFGGGYCPLTAALGDQWVYCANLQAMRGLVAANPALKVYGYLNAYSSAIATLVYNYTNTGCDSKYGYVCHSDELPYLFNTSASWPYLTPSDKAVQALFIYSWINFIYSGDPNTGVYDLPYISNKTPAPPAGKPSPGAGKPAPPVPQFFNRFTGTSSPLAVIKYPVTLSSVSNYRQEQCNLFTNVYGYNQNI